VAVVKNQKNIFRQISPFRTVVDKVINIIPIESYTFHDFINKVITSYPLESVDNRNDCSIGINLVDLGYTN